MKKIKLKKYFDIKKAADEYAKNEHFENSASFIDSYKAFIAGVEYAQKIIDLITQKDDKKTCN